MRTKNADDLLRGETGHASVDAGYQSRDGSYKATVNAAKEFNDKVKGMVIYTYREGHELQTHGDGADIIGEERGKADPMRFSSNNVLSKLELQANESHHFTLTGQYFEQESSGEALSLEGVEAIPYIYSDYSFKDKQSNARIGLEHNWSADNLLFDTLTWKANWQQSQTESSTWDTRTNKFMPILKYYRERQRDVKDSSVQLDVQLDKSFLIGNTDHHLTYGFTAYDGEFTLDTTDIDLKSGEISNGVVEMPPVTGIRKAGIFAQDQIHMLNDRFVVTGGVRYDMFQYRPEEDSRDIPDNPGGYQDADFSAFTGQLGAIYHLTETTSLFGKYARGFKAPTPEELYYRFERNPMSGTHVIYLANPDLTPETSNTIEIGLRQNYGAFNWELAGYYNDYKDYIEEVSWEEEVGNETYYYQQRVNIDDARIYGAELSGALQLGELTSLPRGTYTRFSGSWSRGEDKNSGLAINSVAPMTGIVGLGFDEANGMYGWETVVTAVAGKSGSDWRNPENLSAPGYTTIDITAYARPVKDLTIRGGVFNLTNKKYWNYARVKGATASTNANPDLLSSPGINFGLNAKYEF